MLHSPCKVRAEKCPPDLALWGLRMMAENGFTGDWEWLSEQGRKRVQESGKWRPTLQVLSCC